MSEPQLSNLRKRKHTKLSLPLPQENEALYPQSKRQRRTYQQTPPPVEYWDNLSKIWLTKRALRELDRRNALRSFKSTHSPYQARRPVTRNFHTELERIRGSIHTAQEFITHCEPSTLKNIRLFARHGGPDLLNLRGVCIVPQPEYQN
jgi:hypothetical protein